ncbi:MAG: AAA family ATPase [Desulfovibrionaceae bacterium]|nr:AAA family ATPase [Desulfovibrionaceae bacterium]
MTKQNLLKNSGIVVTLISRPRRFGKNFMLDTVKSFFSLDFADRSNLFYYL